jgi:hypothetical protein
VFILSPSPPVILNPALVILSPSPPVILNEVKDLVFRLRINSAKDLGLWRGVDSVKELVFRLRITP